MKKLLLIGVLLAGVSSSVGTQSNVTGRWRAIVLVNDAQNELGLDHNETRSWHGWHRHVSLVMFAFAMMAVIRYRANDVTPPKRPRMRNIRI